MTKKMHPHLEAAMKEFDLKMDHDLWDCKGKIVAYHHAVERISRQANISFLPPQIITDDFKGKGISILVTGQRESVQEWSIGEAAESNYRVVGKMQAYPWAMAEKRAKDRVVLKLIGLHGIVYSEEESDDFKEPKTDQAPAKQQATNSAETIKDDAKLVSSLLWHIEQTETDTRAFCQHFGIQSVPDMPASRYQEAIDALNRKAEQNKGKAA